MGQQSIISSISYKINFKLQLIKRGRKGHFILPKETINQENITILNKDASKSGVLDLIKSIPLEMKT